MDNNFANALNEKIRSAHKLKSANVLDRMIVATAGLPLFTIASFLFFSFQAFFVTAVVSILLTAWLSTSTRDRMRRLDDELALTLEKLDLIVALHDQAVPA